MGNRLFRRDGLHFFSERVVDCLQGSLFEVNVSEVVVHEADKPDAVIDFGDADALACHDGGDVDLLSVNAEAAASGDQGVGVMEGIVQVRQAVIGALCVEFADEIIKPHLLGEVIGPGRPGGFLLQGEVHALMAPILLGMARPDALDGDAEAQPPDGEFGEGVEPVGAGKGHAIVGAYGAGQTAL